MISSLIRAFNAFVNKWAMFNVSTATYTSLSKSISEQDTSPRGLAFSSDGTKMFIVGTVNDTVYQYTLSTPWNVSTAVYASSKSVGVQDGTPYGLAFSSDGTKMFIVGNTTETVYQYNLSTAWNVSTATYTSLSKSISEQDTSPRGLAFSSDGTKMFMVGNVNYTVYQYNLSTPWNVSTAVYASSKLVSAQDTNPHGLAFSSDGTKMFIVGNTTETVYQYTLSTPWNVSTAVYASLSKSVTAQDATPLGLAFSSDGTKMFIVGNTTDTVYQYTL